MPVSGWVPFGAARTSPVFYNYAEMNQVEANINALAAYMQSMQYNVPALTAVTSRTESFIDTISSVNRLENNLDTLRTSFITPPDYLPKKTWGVGVRLNYDDPNRWEKNLQNLFDYAVSVQKTTMYCGEVIAGGFKIRANWADGEEQTTNDTIPPTTPGALVLISKTATTALLSWSPSYDYRGIATYQLYSGSLLWETTDTKITVLSLTPNTLYSFYVVAKDAAGNVSGASPTLTFATDAAPVEIPTAPAPTGLTVMGMSDTTVTLSWETTPGSYAVAAGSGIVAAADTSGYLSWMASSGVVEYHISGGPSLVVTSGSTVTITGLTPNTFYGFTIKGKYTDGKFSLVSDLVTVTTLDVGVSINYRLTGDSGPLNGGSTASGTTY